MDKSVLNKKISFKKSGFTLIEILVSMMVFMIFVTIALSTLIISNNSGKKSTAIKTAIDNVQYSTEVFTRTARLGSMYTCFSSGVSSIFIDPTTGVDCATPGQGVAFFLLDPTVTPNQTDVYAYYLQNSSGNGRIIRCIERNVYPGGIAPTTPYLINLLPGFGNCAPLTAKEIDITQFDLIVNGTSITDTKQPSIKMKLSGNVEIPNGNGTDFSIQTFISQRQYE